MKPELIPWDKEPICFKCKRIIRRNDVRYITIHGSTGQARCQYLICIPCLSKLEDFLHQSCEYPKNEGEHPTAWYSEENILDAGWKDFNLQWSQDQTLSE